MSLFFKRLILLTTLLSSSRVFAQVADYKVMSLYEQDALLTERFLPFEVLQTSDNAKVELVSAYADKPCYAMVDPHRAHIALFFCTEAKNDAHFFVKIKRQGTVFNFKTPPLVVRKLALLSSTPDPYKPPIPDSPGEILYKNNCASCHTASNPMVETTSVNALKAEFAKAPPNPMQKFHNFFSEQQLKDLVSYINEEL